MALLAILSFVLVSCKSDGAQDIIPKKDGLWKEESRQIIKSTSGTVTSDVTKTDSLRNYYFDKSYVGYYTEFADTAEIEYNWWKWSDKDRIVLESNTFRHEYDVISSAMDAQTWSEVIVSTNGRNKTETIIVLNRVQ